MQDLETAHCHIRLAASTINLHSPYDVQLAMTALTEIRETIARFKTEPAGQMDLGQLTRAGVNPRHARTLIRRAENEWDDGVPADHQDEILRALSSLCPTSTRREEIYDTAATEVVGYTRATSPEQTWRFTRDLVQEENQRLATDPIHARAQRRFTLQKPDEHGGAKFSGYVTPEIGALLQALMDQTFSTTPKNEGDLRTVAQRQHDAFAEVVE